MGAFVPALLPWGFVIRAALLSVALAAPAAAVSLLCLSLAAPAIAVLAVLEAAFAGWWLTHSSRLSAVPGCLMPKNMNPEKDFAKLLTFARTVRVDAGAASAAPVEDNLKAPRVDTDTEQLKTTSALDVKLFLSQWFSGADFSAVRRGNVAELLAYGFYYKSLPQMEAAGLGAVPGQMVAQLEQATGTQLPDGYQPGLSAMYHLWEPMRFSYRPFLFYVAMELLALWTRALVTLLLGFRPVKQGRVPCTPAPAAVQERPAQLAAPSRPPSVQMYDLDPRQELGRAAAAPRAEGVGPCSPILFLHGVGAGLLPYLPWVCRLAASGRRIIMMEARHVSMRLCSHIPAADQVAEDVVAALDDMGVGKVCVVGHSYGTFVASCLAQQHPDRVQSLSLIDPVCLGVFLPNLIKNFIYRHQQGVRPGSMLGSIMDFISRDVHMAATFCRRFYWSDVNMWVEDIPPQTLVVLSGRDELMHVEEVRHALSAHTSAKVLYHPDHEHAGFLLDAEWQDAILKDLLLLSAGGTASAR